MQFLTFFTFCPCLKWQTREDYYALETRASDLYGLFAVSGPEAPGAESDLRVRRC